MKFGKIIDIESVPQEKPLNDLISDIKKLMKPYQSQIEVKICDVNGKYTEIQIIVRIRP